MNYYSLNHQSPTVSFKQALYNGLASDNGLYFPENIQKLRLDFFTTIENYSTEEVAYEVMKQFIGDEIPTEELHTIINETLSFPFPLINVEKDIFTLELFHGPTMAFKDVGARFMSRCLAYFSRTSDEKRTVLVATSGDTGGAVAHGFYNVENIDVVILYPAGKVSDIQERQLTTLGGNIRALKVDGVFDDCQDMVKKSFLDSTLKHKNLTSANSINIARWLPQMIYFFLAYRDLKKNDKPLIFSCPSGNFGNICAGVLAKKLGLPAKHFVAATNINDVIPRFVRSGQYEPKASLETISNAMDVGNPSNFVRILEMYDHSVEKLKADFSSVSFTDAQTLDAIRYLYTTSGYIADPHGAIGYLGLKKELPQFEGAQGVFLETAHPIKFSGTIEQALNIKLAIPSQIESVLHKEKKSVNIKNYADLHAILSS